MAEKDLYKDITMKELLIILRKLRIQYINGTRILFPVKLKGIYSKAYPSLCRHSNG